MSRHRAIKSMVDDYYDEDYYDDDYYDEDEYYEEEEGDGYDYEEQNHSQYYKKDSSSNNNKNEVSAKTATSSASSSAFPPSLHTKSVSYSTTTTKTTTVPALGQKKGGVSQPPPGFGKPTPNNDHASKKGGVMAPPPGFGKPKSIDTMTSATSQMSVTSKSQSKTKSKSTHNTPRTTPKTSPKKNRVMTPPPGFGRPKDTSVSTVKVTSSVSSASGAKNKPSKATSSSTSSSATAPATTSTSTSTSTKKPIPPSLKSTLKSQKSRLSMVILGHVDAGKSTLMGQVLLQLQYITSRTITKYQQQSSAMGKGSFALAWVMDEDESERERGVTIDIASKQISLDKHEIMVLDAPGHQEYVPAMITGAAAADVGLLVVAATTGEFESGFDEASGSGYNGGKGHVGQTREHVTLARGLGVTQLIVAVNKLDSADPPWSQHRYEEIQQRLLPFLLQQGFNAKRVTFVPISGLNGVNIQHPPSAQKEEEKGLVEWYQGPTLVQAMNGLEPAKRQIEKPFRFIVTDMFADGKGVLVKGRVVQGVISVGDKVVVLPVGDEALLKWMDHGSIGGNANAGPYGSASGTTSSSTSTDSPERYKLAMAGDAVDLTLTGIDISRINTGNILSDIPQSQRPKLQKKCRAKIHVMDQLSLPILCGSQVLFHMHSLDVPCVITKIITATKKGSSTVLNRPRLITGGSTATVEMKLQEKICMETFQECRALGRFALRRGGSTIAVGVIDSL